MPKKNKDELLGFGSLDENNDSNYLIFLISVWIVSSLKFYNRFSIVEFEQLMIYYYCVDYIFVYPQSSLIIVSANYLLTH